MIEYISRKKALGQFDSNPTNQYAAAARNLINSVPAADVAPVVRCKNCRNFGTTQSHLCDMHHRAANDDDYCSYGVRKVAPEVTP